MMHKKFLLELFRMSQDYGDVGEMSERLAEIIINDYVTRITESVELYTEMRDGLNAPDPVLTPVLTPVQEPDPAPDELPIPAHKIEGKRTHGGYKAPLPMKFGKITYPSMNALCKELGLHYGTFHKKVSKGMPVKEAVKQMQKKNKQRKKA